MAASVDLQKLQIFQEYINCGGLIDLSFQNTTE